MASTRHRPPTRFPPKGINVLPGVIIVYRSIRGVMNSIDDRTPDEEQHVTAVIGLSQGDQQCWHRRNYGPKLGMNIAGGGSDQCKGFGRPGSTANQVR